MYIVALLLGIAALAYGQDVQHGSDSRMGYGFFLPKKDIMGVFTGGAPLFKNIRPDCIITSGENYNKIERLTTFYDSTESFFSRVSADTEVSASLKGKYTMSATLNIKSKSIAAKTLRVIGSSLWMAVYKKYETFAKACENQLELDDHFKNAFESLPNEVTNPQRKSSWNAFQVFLDTYGSHFVTETSFGAYLEQWSFAKAEKKYTSSQLEARVCGDFLGPTQYGELEVSACGGYSKQEIQASQSLETSKSLTVKGGTLALGNKLVLDTSKTNMEAFLNSASKDSPVGHKFSPVFSLLRNRYIGTPHFKKALNLHYYYEGFLDYECSEDHINGHLVRRFVRDSDYTTENPSYRCELAPQGCRNDDSCDYGVLACYCAGPACFRHSEKEVAGRKIPSIYAQTSRTGGKWDNVNGSCKYDGWFGCDCNSGWGGSWRKVWASNDV